jgi:hypothetical protein
MKITVLGNPNQPDMRPVKSKDDVLYRLEKSYSIKLCIDGERYNIRVPQGFYTDGQSSPKIFWSLFRPDGIVRLAALIHDALYRSEGGLQFPIKRGLNRGKTIYVLKGLNPTVLKRKTCDAIYRTLYNLMGIDVSRKAGLGYLILRVFGGRYFGSIMPSEGRREK